MESNESLIQDRVSLKSENSNLILEKDKSSWEEKENNDMHVTFLSSLIIPPRSNIIPRIKLPKQQFNENKKNRSLHSNHSPRLSQPIYFDLPPITPPDNSIDFTSSISIKSKNQNKKTANQRRPLSTRDSYNQTLTSFLSSIEKKMVSPRAYQKQQAYNDTKVRSSSSRRSYNENQMTNFSSKVKVQKPLSPRYYRKESERQPMILKNRFNSKYTK